MKTTDNKQENDAVNGFVFYRSYYDAIETLSMKNKLIVYEAIARYALNGEEPMNLPIRALGIFKVTMRNLDANRRKYLKKIEKASLSNQKETSPIFEKGVILPKKEKKLINNDNDTEFIDDDADDADEFDP